MPEVQNFRMIQIPVEAIQVPDANGDMTVCAMDVHDVATWAGGKVARFRDEQGYWDRMITVPIEGGIEIVRAGDWITKTLEGEFRTYSDESFKQAFELSA